MAQRCPKCGDWKDDLCANCGEKEAPSNALAQFCGWLQVEGDPAFGIGIIFGLRGFVLIFGPLSLGLLWTKPGPSE